ncbi:MAG: chemotaxis protein CheA, partial [Acidiferrobacterales bacterium]
MSRIDPGTLGWVKTEIDETLKQARLALEVFAENPSDTTSLRFCNTYLHQVLGTLQMVELDGAGMLARENEALAQAILDGKVDATPAVFEVLVRGILSLPDYLARVQHDQPDAPLRLLPIINELRLTRGDKPLADLDLFSPDMTVSPPARPGDRVRASEEDFRAHARAQRGAFQASMLNWLRGNDARTHLVRMSETLESLGRKAHLGFIEQLFWVAGGFAEALGSGAVEATNDRKKLFGRVDQQLKKLIDGTDKGTQRADSEALTKAMLFELGAVKSNEGRVGEIKRAFDLDTLLGTTAGAAIPSSELYDLPTPEALQAISEAIGKEIRSAQDMLSAYFDSGERNATSLGPLIELLQRMSGTLGILGAGVLRVLVDELAEAARALDSGRINRSEAAAMPMAGALLLVESSARDFHRLGPVWTEHVEEAISRLRNLHQTGQKLPVEGIEISDAGLTDTEFRQLLHVVSGEIRVNLGKVEEMLETFAATPERLELLQPIPQHLSQIQGALQILGQDRVAELTAATGRYIQEMQSSAVAENAMLDALAVAVGTIGAYVEGLERERPNLEALLRVAWRDLDAARSGRRLQEADAGMLVAEVEKALVTWLADPSEPGVRAVMQDNLRHIARVARRRSQDRIERLCGEMDRLLGIVGADPKQFSTEIKETLEQSAEMLSGLVQRMGAEPEPQSEPRARANNPALEGVAPEGSERRPVPSQPAPSPSPGMEDLDEEIMQIFVEDAREIIQVIDRTLPAWRGIPENREVLLELRRAFHTLKGSGRMVGASVIAELAWAVENMLNRVREEKIRHSDQMFELLFEVQRVLPVMVAQLEGGPAAPQADIDSLRSRADALASNNVSGVTVTSLPASMVGIEVIEEPAAADTTPVVSETAGPPAFDPVLVQIFTAETRGHLETIAGVVQGSHGTASVMVSEPLLRAAHTLSGSARAVGLRPMSDCCAELEKLLKMSENHQHPLSAATLGLLTELMAAVTALVEALNRGAPVEDLQPGFVNLTHVAAAEIQRLALLDAAVQESSTAAHHVPQPGHAGPKAAEPVEAVPPQKYIESTQPVVEEETVIEQTDPELLEIFLEEAVDILSAVGDALTRWRQDRGDSAAVQDLKRSLHTLKGGARMAGAMTMGALSHSTESLLKEVEDRRMESGTDLLDLLDEVHDVLITMVDQMQSRRPVSGVAQLTAKITALLKGESVAEPVPTTAPPPAAEVTELPPTGQAETDLNQVPATAAEVYPVPQVAPGPAAAEPSAAPEPELVAVPVQEPEPEAVPQIEVEPEVEADLVAESAMVSDHVSAASTGTDIADRRAEPAEGSDAGSEAADRRGQIKVRTSLLSRLVNYAGEVSISRSRMQQQIYGFRENLAELNRNVTRFRDQIRELEIHSESQILYRAEQSLSSAGSGFDPLEFDRFSRLQHLSRGLAESLHDLYTIQSSMDTFVGEAETVLQQQARVNTELQEGLMRTRMISFSTQAARLRHIVRQTARELGKRVELQLSGAEVEVDRTVLERMIGPFEHMIRNSIDHGIEDETARRRAGKPAIAKISIETRHEGSEIAIRFSDDGAGLNIAAIRTKAVERGLIAPNTVLSDEELMQFILVSGFSTASKVTHLSGRGVGMDVVHNEIKQLGGSITVDTRKGLGATFIIRLPLTLSIAQ